MSENKIFEVNGRQSQYPLELDIVKPDGNLEDYYLISGDARDKITLADMVNSQIEIINSEVTAEADGEDSAQNASSGDSAQNASSGYYAKNASSGYYAKNASSGYSAKNASSGYSAKNASSGDYAKNASSGDYAKNASSGDYAQNITEGKHSVTMACGFLSTIKAVAGTWISLCEFSKETIESKEVYVPSYAASAQIGNSEYVDYNGNVLSEDEHYMLYNKKFQPVINADGFLLIKNKSRKVGEATVHTCTRPYAENEKVYVAELNELYAHGSTVKEALSDLQYKILSSKSVEEHVVRVKAQGIVSREDYRLITGACRYGVAQFCRDKGIEDVQELSIDELLKILDGHYYGADKFRKFFTE